MPSRRLALLGTAQGPWICTNGVQRPQARIVGRPNGLKVVVFVCYDSTISRESAIEELEVDVSGPHILPEAPWMRVSAPGAPKTMIVEIISRAA